MRLAIIGCGAVVEQFHVPALKKIGWKPQLCIDPNIAQAKIISKKFNARPSRSYTNLIDLFDAAIVAVPHSFHKQVAEDLLKNNKHILLEKPIASNFDEAKVIMKSEKYSEGTIQIGLLRRYLESMIWLKEAIDKKYFGKIYNLSIYEGSAYSWPVKSDSFWDKKKSGGGVLLDTGAHTIDLLLWIFGDAKLVDYKDDSLGGVEADCSIILEFNYGFNANIELSRTRSLGAYGIIKSEKGDYKFSLVSNNIESLSKSTLNDIPKFSKQSFNKLAYLQLMGWSESIREKKEVYVSSYDAAKSIELIQNCYKNKKPLDYLWI